MAFRKPKSPIGNISEHPKYYTNDFKNNLTNPGSFFDKQNKYHDTTSSNTYVLPSDNCYIDKNGNTFCRDNTRIQNISPKLINDSYSSSTLDIIGSYKSACNKTNADSILFNNVKPSKKMGTNESYDSPLQPMLSTF